MVPRSLMASEASYSKHGIAYFGRSAPPFAHLRALRHLTRRVAACPQLRVAAGA